MVSTANGQFQGFVGQLRRRILSLGGPRTLGLFDIVIGTFLRLFIHPPSLAVQVDVLVHILANTSVHP